MNGGRWILYLQVVSSLKTPGKFCSGWFLIMSSDRVSVENLLSSCFSLFQLLFMMTAAVTSCVWSKSLKNVFSLGETNWTTIQFDPERDLFIARVRFGVKTLWVADWWNSLRCCFFSLSWITWTNRRLRSAESWTEGYSWLTRFPGWEIHIIIIIINNKMFQCLKSVFSF